MKKWKRLLKPGGYIAVSEISWLRQNPPDEVKEYWSEQYPVQDIESNVRTITDAGYERVGHFALPARDWWDDYYDHIMHRLPMFQEKYKDDTEALQVVDMEKVEMEMHKKYSDFYGYVFYVMQKIC